MSSRAANTWRVWLALTTVYVVWGSTYLAIRVMVKTMPALLSAGARFALAGAMLYAWLAWRRGLAGVRVRARELAAAALVGTLLAGGGNGLVTLAERDVPSGLAALIIGSVPLWVVLLRALARERVGAATLAGVGVGFAGVALLLLPGSQPAGATTLGVILLLAAAASWATGSFSSSRLPLPRDPLVSTALQMACAGLVMTLAGLAGGEAGDVHVSAFSADSLLAFAYLVLIGSLVAFTAYVWLLQHAPISLVATYAYVNPVIAVFLGWAILSETVAATTILGAAVIVASVAATVRRESDKRPVDSAPADAPLPPPRSPFLSLAGRRPARALRAWGAGRGAGAARRRLRAADD